MPLPTFEQNGDTIVLRQSTKMLQHLGIFFIIIALVLLLVLYRMLNQPLTYLFPGVEMLIGFLLIYFGADYTYTLNRTIKTFSRQTKNQLRNTTDTWRFNDIKEVMVKSIRITPKYGTGYFEYRVWMVMETGKKMKVYTSRQIDESNKVQQLLQQFIFNYSAGSNQER